MSDIIWDVEPGCRADIVCFAHVNLSGKRTGIRVFPGGKVQGSIATEDLGSLLLIAPTGTRMILKTQKGANWENHPWRCVQIVEGSSVPPNRGAGLPGVRVPNLELLDVYDAKKTDYDREISFPMAERLADGSGWTFGRHGTLKHRIREIRIDRGGAEDADVATERRITVFRALDGVESLLRSKLERHLDKLRAASGHVDAQLFVTKGSADQFTLIAEYTEPPPEPIGIDGLLARPAAVIEVERIG